MKKIKVITLFTGIGAQEAALKRLGIDYEVVGISEIDKYAIQSYEAINGSTRNYGDITKIDALDYADLWTYSSPCQDFSTAGKQAGIRNSDGSLTRSGLLLHVERLLIDSVIRGDQPKYLLMENVKGLVSKKFKPDFDRWLERLEQLGYNNYWQVLNAKDYGVPQNRERVFVVSIRKDTDINGYKFPEKIPLIKRLKDVLENEVDEKYYLSDKKVERFSATGNVNPSGRGINGNVCTGDVCNTLTTNKGEGLKILEPLCAASRGRGNNNTQTLEVNKTGCTNTLTSVQKDNYIVEPKIIQVGNIVNTGNWDNPIRGHIYSPDGCSPALNTVGGGGLEPKIIELGYFPYENSDKKHQSNTVISPNGLCPTLDTCTGGNRMPKIVTDEFDLSITDYRIRKLTPRECWRLMGFTDIEFDCAQMSGNSNSQLYKQAGNSIVVDVLACIFRELFNDRP